MSEYSENLENPQARAAAEAWEKERNNPEKLRAQNRQALEAMTDALVRLREFGRDARESNPDLADQLLGLANDMAEFCIDASRRGLPPCPVSGKKCQCWSDSLSRAHCANDAGLFEPVVQETPETGA